MGCLTTVASSSPLSYNSCQHIILVGKPDMETRRTTSIEEFMKLLAEYPDRQWELIDGEIIEMPPAYLIHTYIVARFHLMLETMLSAIAYVFPDGAGYQLGEQTLVVPDASVVLKQRLPKLPNKYIHFGPDIAVEVVSESNTPRQLHHKVEVYLQHGSQYVWLVYPDEQIVEVYTPSQDSNSMVITTRTIADVLTIPNIDAQFTLPVRDIFPPDGLFGTDED